MLVKIFIGLAVIVVIFAVVVATRPSEFRVERTAAMAAPAPVVFAQVNDFHRWDAWSPYAKRDPAMKKSFEGAPAESARSTRGPATTRWEKVVSSSSKAGRMT